jgi:hypothetical protein
MLTPPIITVGSTIRSIPASRRDSRILYAEIARRGRQGMNQGTLESFMSQGQSSVALEMECSVLVFPPERQASRVREVAGRLMRKRSQKAADAECSRVADEMFARLAALGLGEAEQDEAVGAFFHEVDCEMDRLSAARTPGCACCREA